MSRLLPVLIVASLLASSGCAPAASNQSDRPTNPAPSASVSPTATPPAASTASSTASPTASPTAEPSQRLTGAITYMHDDATGHPQTWTACADLSHAKRLTSIAGHGSGWPVWSPDGKRIAIDTDRNDAAGTGEINDVYTMDAHGGDVRKLTDSVGVSGDPGYSPDGKLIAFGADRGDPKTQGIFVMNATDGSHKRRLTTIPATARDDHAPRFSPDGMQIVFTREVNDTEAELDVVNVDGSGLRRITTWSVDPGDATWSPDGTRIVFEANLTFDGRTGPWIVGADGSDEHSLTGPQDLSGDWNGFADPVWSPDGTLILVLHGIHHPDESFPAGLATIRPDGTGLRYLGDGQGAEHQADWSATATC
jgi:Tol biopolymer transport system component